MKVVTSAEMRRAEERAGAAGVSTQELMARHWFSSDPQPDDDFGRSWLVWRPTPAWVAVGAIALAAALGSISSQAAFLYYQF